MNRRGLSIIATTALLGGSLFLGTGAAMASGGCPTGQHMNVGIAGAPGFCSPDVSGGGTGGSITYNGGATGNGPAPAPIQVPGYTAPSYTAPAYNPPPAYSAPAQPVYRAPAVPAAPTGGGWVAPAAPASAGYAAPASAGHAPAFTAPSGAAVQKNDQGVWVNPSTGEAADAGVAAQAEAAATAPADPAAAADAQAKADQEATVAKAAAVAVVQRQIDVALDQALDNALANR